LAGWGVQPLRIPGNRPHPNAPTARGRELQLPAFADADRRALACRAQSLAAGLVLEGLLRSGSSSSP
jgi:hypothetical protein